MSPSGSQFDPRVVDVFVTVPIDEWKYIKNHIASSGSEYLKQLMFELSKYRI